MKKREHSLYMFESYRAAFAEVVSFCQLANPGDVCFCIGPGGAGKSEMAALIGESVYGPAESWIPRTQPYVHVGADLEEQSFFTPKAFMRKLLSDLKDPFTCQQAEVADWEIHPDVKRALMLRSRFERRFNQTEAEMRSAFISVARLLKVSLIIIDEANMFLISPKSRTPTDYLESVRRLGDQVGCPIVLFGTTDLIKLLDYSAQLNRRINKTHIGQMRCRSDSEKGDFIAFLTSIESDFNLESGLLANNPAKIFEWTYGIPGEILGLVEKSRYKAARRGIIDVDFQALLDARKSDAELKRCVEEADAIESIMTNKPLVKVPRVIDQRGTARRGRKPSRTLNGNSEQ